MCAGSDTIIHIKPDASIINPFIFQNYNQIVTKLKNISLMYTSKNTEIRTSSEKPDTRTAVFKYYKGEKTAKRFSLFVCDMASKGTEKILQLNDEKKFGENDSFNTIYEAVFLDHKLLLKNLANDRIYDSPDQIADDIWENCIKPDLII